MADRCPVIAALELATQLEQGLRRLEAYLDLPAVAVDADDLLIAERAVRAEQEDAFAALVAVAHEDDAQRDALVARIDLEGAVAFLRIPGGNQMHQTAQRVEPATEPVLLPAVLGHADDLQPEIADAADERLRREPGIHQQVFCLDAGRQRALHEAERGLRLVQHAFHARLVARRPVVDPFIRLLVAIVLVRRREQVESHGDEAEPVRPAKCQQVVAADTVADRMVEHAGKELDGLAAVARDGRVIQNQRTDASFPGQPAQCRCDTHGQEQEEATPVEGCVVHEAIERILAGTGLLSMGRSEIAEQVQVAERQQEKESECLVSGNSAALADVCTTKELGDLQFLHDAKKFGGGIPIGDVLL